MKLKPTKNSILTGLLGGLAGTLIMEISNLIIFKKNKTEALYGHIAGGLLVPSYKTKQKKNFILGELVHFAMGMFWGIPLVYLLKKTGKDRHLIKGLLIAMLSLGQLIILQKVGWTKKFRLTKTYYSAFWNHLLYGLVASQAIVTLADSEMFQNKNSDQ